MRAAVVRLVETCQVQAPAIFAWAWNVVHPVVHALGWDRWLGI